VRLFLDTSVLLAAADSATGASRSIFDLSEANNWELLTTDYCLEEFQRKDRPVLLSALSARADYLITLDVADFQNALGPQIYGMQIRKPGQFIDEQRRAQALREV